MNSATTYTISTIGSAATVQLGQAIGRQLKGGDVIELKGDVGSGKTTLTAGIAAGLGFSGQVTSPTFTLSRAYPLKEGLMLYHFDFYRLQGYDIATQELQEAFRDSQAIVVIEWPGNGNVNLPDVRLRIMIALAADEQQRTIIIESLKGGGSKVVKQVSHDYRS